MYFKLLNKSTKWEVKTSAGTVIVATQAEDGKISVSTDTYGSLEELVRLNPKSSVSFIGPVDETYQLDTVDGDHYKVRRENGKLKLWGRTIKVTLFDDWGSLCSHFSEIFIKNIEAFENPEYICTDSKGRYVATIKKNGAVWDVTVSDAPSPIHSGPCLNAAFEYVLRSTDI